MTTKEKDGTRGRPRQFDVETALDAAEALFHQHGYEGVGVAALTEALGIKPPSFYAAFGSKAALFGQVLERYASRVLPLHEILTPGRPIEALTTLLEAAARLYACDPRARGCLIIEAARLSNDAESAQIAREIGKKSYVHLHGFIAETHADVADVLSDFIASTLAGLSAKAREGWNTERLLSVAHIAASAIPRLLKSPHHAAAGMPRRGPGVKP